MLVTSIPQTKFGFLFHLDISILSETALPHGGKTERKYITPSVSFFTTKHFNIPGAQRFLSTKEFPNHYVYPKPTKNKRSCLRPPFYLPHAPLQGPCRCSKATDESRPGDGYFVQVGMGSLGLSGQPFQFHQICRALPLSCFTGLETFLVGSYRATFPVPFDFVDESVPFIRFYRAASPWSYILPEQPFLFH